MTDFRELCAELLADYEQHLFRSVLAERARAALAEPEPERLTVQQINDLPEHRESYIYSDSRSPDVIQLDGTFTRAELQQLADSILTGHEH